MWIFPLFLNLLVLAQALSNAVLAAQAPSGDVEQMVTTTVTSQKMTFKNQQSQAVFDGSVVLTRGTLIVYSDRMVVTFREPNQSGNHQRNSIDATQSRSSAKGPDTVSNRSVSQIEAIGRVKIEREAGSATCEKAIYYRDEDKIVLTGDPVAWEKGTRVSGKRITLFLAEDRTVVDGGSHVHIEPEVGGK